MSEEHEFPSGTTQYSDLRRPVGWADQGHPYDELPEELQQRLPTQHDAVGLTVVEDLIDGLGLSDQDLIDEAAALRMRPDFVLYGPDGIPCAVADAKYKAEKRDGYPDADLYQMPAYCTALGLSAGHLAHAKGNASHAAHRVRRAGILIHQHALDLDQEPAGLLADVGKVARRMRNG